MSRIGIFELLVIFLVVIILFGPKKLPEIGRAIGDAIKEFKRSMKDVGEDSGKEQDGKKG